jgi:TyrR family helix-turn-helix protein
MRIDVQFQDRVGIAHEVLAVLAARKLNVVAVEVDPPHVYIDIPQLTNIAALRGALLTVAGVHTVQQVDVLPGTRRRLHLDALLAAMADPVLALDARGCVVVANAAAQGLVADATVNAGALEGKSLEQIFDDPGLQAELVASSFRLPAREVTLQGKPFLLDVTPVSERGQVSSEPGSTVGAVVTLHAPQRLGGALHALQNFAAQGFDAIIGQSASICALKARALRAAQVDAPLMIIGETGTGKELVAQACHAASPRANAPFLALNCAALPESLAESELFGYTTGAFSGAQRGGKPGLIELAGGGTVFLDEVGEMSLYLQAKLLRFLNDGKFRRIGGEREIKVNVRIICATHRNLEQMVAERTFREDLYYRLNVLNLLVPPLRERPDDILLLTRHFIERACQQAQKPLCRLGSAAQAALSNHAWPGNVRQLQNVIFRAITMADNRVLDVADLDLYGAQKGGGGAGAAVDAMPPAAGAKSAQAAGTSLPAPASLPDALACTDWSEAVAQFEAQLLRALYPHYRSSRKLAARVRMSHSMMALKLKKYGIGGEG